MPKKEEKKKEDEKEAEKVPEAEETKDQTEKKEAIEESGEDTKPISELAQEGTTKPTESTEKEEKEKDITMEPVSVNPVGTTETPPIITPSEPSTPTNPETLPIDQITDSKPVQETYPLADEIEKDAIKKKSFFSSLLIFRNKKGKIILLILVILLIIGLAAGTIMNTNNEKLSFMKLNNKTRETVVLSPTQPPSPTPTPVAVDKASLTIQVQNGSGESGVASEMKNFLAEKGYEGTIDTGNADNYDYTETVVKVKATKASIEETLRSDLSETYTLSEEKEELEDSSEYDIVIIVGAE